MLEMWEKEGASLLLGEEKQTLLLEAKDDENVLDLSAPIKKPGAAENRQNQYDSFFD